jgi:hypothetical protein
MNLIIFHMFFFNITSHVYILPLLINDLSRTKLSEYDSCLFNYLFGNVVNVVFQSVFYLEIY